MLSNDTRRIPDFDQFLSLDLKAFGFQLGDKSAAVNAFKETWAQGRVHRSRSIDDLIYQAFVRLHANALATREP